MERINILFVMLQMAMGGAERLILNLARKLDRSRMNPSIAWFLGDRSLEEFRELGIPMFHISKTKRIDLGAMCALDDVIQNNNIHIVNSHHFMPTVYSFYGSKIRHHKKLIYTEHSEWEIDEIPWKWQKVGRFLLNRTDGVVGVNEAVSKKIKSKFGADGSRIFTIANGVELRAGPQKDRNDVLRNQLGIRSNEKVIGIVANFRRNKNHIFLLRAVSEVVKKNADVKLLVIGKGFDFDPENSEADIEKYIRAKGLTHNVLLLGYRADVGALLNIMDVFCLTSFQEGLPISLIEAMAAGLPVIGTDVEGIRDVVVPNENGFLVQNNDVIALRECLLRLLENDALRLRMGGKSKTLAEKKYSLSECVSRYQELFSSVMNGAHADISSNSK